MDHRAVTDTTRDGSSPKILGGGIAPISPFITESTFSVLRSKTKYELHIDRVADI